MGNFYIPNKEVPPKKKVVGGTLVFSDPNDPEYKYRKQMYNDSLNLYNYTAEQKRLESPLDNIPFLRNNNRDNNQNYLFDYADKIEKSSPYIDFGVIGMNKQKTRADYNKSKSPDILHKTIKPDGTWIGEGANNDYSNVKPVTPIKLEVPPIPKKPKVPITPPIAPPTTPPVKEEQISYEEWYKTVPKEKNDTTSYNLKRAYELAPKEQLNAFVQDPDAHLMSAYQTSDGNYEFVKSKNHPTLNKELDWYNSDNPDAIDFRNNYDLDTTGEYYKYIKKEQPKVEEVKKPEYVQGSTIWLNNTTPMLEHNGKNYILDINSPEVNQVYTEQGNKLVTKELTQAQIDLLLKATKQ